jgi:hypothetical protein
MKKSLILDIYSSPNTIFSVRDISLLWRESNIDLVKKRIYRFVKSGKLYPVRKGLYAKNKDYDKYELATKIYTPSYISFETVLAMAGVIFQYYGQIFVASYLAREITVDKQKYSYRKIKDSILTDDTGIESKGNYAIATPERAFLDVIYLEKDYYFDNPSSLDWDKVNEILPIYSNKRMEKEIKKYQEEYNV